MVNMLIKNITQVMEVIKGFYNSHWIIKIFNGQLLKVNFSKEIKPNVFFYFKLQINSKISKGLFSVKLQKQCVRDQTKIFSLTSAFRLFFKKEHLIFT